jgi:glycosyltransferase involved in cell wall biosynthesis
VTSVAVDATLVGTRVKGAARVLVNMLRTLPKAASDLDVVALAGEDGVEVVGRTGVRVVGVSYASGVRWELRGAATAARNAGGDVLFTVRELTPLGGVPTVVHVFEPPSWRIPRRLPTSVAAAKYLAKNVLLHAAFGRSLRRAAAVTAGSRTTAEWIARRSGVAADVVLPGIDPVFLDAVAADPPAEPFFLHPSTGDERENTPLVLDAFARPDAPKASLRLVGAPDAVRARLEDDVRRRGLSGRVEILGWVEDAELRSLYATATALVHPTRYESYAGLPALEAMALGTPVVALDAPGSTEGLAGAAILLEREDPAELATRLRALEDDPALRASLAAAGADRARALTWERAAAELAVVLRRVAGR